ncbi:MAG: carboxypeptidase regulatory-like domain-containing protein, partial [Ilumatobacter sp.]|nr:carboxypeptidase regulatory-like domain-containing protein [Ilumatobacter sp.]
FDDARSSSNGFHIDDMVIGDVDGDGRDDVVSFAFGQRDTAVAPYDPLQRDGWVLVQRADGFGGFEPGFAYPLGVGHGRQTTSTEGLDLGDVDGDGDLDIVAGLDDRLELLTLLNDGDGNFPSEVRTPVAETADGTVLLVEVTGDAFVDVVATSEDGDLTMILRGLGDGSFVDEATLPGTNPNTVTAIDLLDDGVNHLITNGSNSRLTLWSRDVGLGTWSSVVLTMPSPSNPELDVEFPSNTALVGDVDSDGDDDVVAVASTWPSGNGCGGSNGSLEMCVRVLLNDGLGGLDVQPEYWWAETHRYITGNYAMTPTQRGEMYDLDADGNLDIVLPGIRGAATVYYGIGDGTFTDQVSHNVFPNVTPLGGWPDTSPGHFVATRAVAVTDVDDDGRPDLIGATQMTTEWSLAGEFFGTVAWVRSTGVREFEGAEATSTLPGGDWIQSERNDMTHLVDWNGDDLDDVVIFSAGGGEYVNQTAVVMRPGDGAGGFGPTEHIGVMPRQCLTGTNYFYDSAVGDIDEDGNLDVVCGDNELAVAFGDGAGGLDEALELGPLDGLSNSTNMHGVTIADVDGDGLRDVLYVTNRYGLDPEDPESQRGTLMVGWSRQVDLGGGVTELSPVEIIHERKPVDTTSTSVWSSSRGEFGDFDGDGDLDMAITANHAPNRLTIVTNESTPGAAAFTSAASGALSHKYYRYLTALDVDDDDDVDLVATMNEPSGNPGPQRWSNEILRNDGAGGFIGEALPNSNGQPSPLAVDVDDDGYLDLVFATSYRGVEVRRGDENGDFAPAVTFPIGDRGLRWLAMTDLDGDELLDVVAMRDMIPRTDRTRGDLITLTNTSTGIEGAADLVVASVAVEGDTSSSDLTVAVGNVGGEIAGAFTTTFWLSEDDVWDLGDRPLGEVDHPAGLFPGSDSTETLTTPLLPLVDGQQFVIARVDPYREVVEIDEQNNTGSVAVDLPVPELVVGGSLVVTPTAGAPAVARVDGAGAPVRISVSGAASTLVVTEGGRVPGAAGGEASLIGPGTFVVPAFAGDTYLRVEGSGTVTLSAVGLAFGAGSVSPRVIGNTGTATLTVDGVGLDDTLTVSLVGPATVVASAVSSTTATRLVATLPMASAPLGTYDLVVSDGSTTSTLPDAVSVQAPSVPVGDGDVNQLIVSTFAPTRTRGGATVEYFVTYGNRGLTDIIAPFLAVTVTGASAPADSGLDYDDTIYVPADIPGAPIGVLPPGATARVRLPFVVGGNFDIELDVYSGQNPQAYDWPYELRSDPPGGLTQAEYDAVIAGLESEIGDTAGDFVAAAQRLRSELASAGTPVDDLGVLRRILVDRVVAELPGAFIEGTVIGVTDPAGLRPLVTASNGTHTLTTTTFADGTFAFRDSRLGGDDPAGEWTLSIDGFGPAPLTTVTAPIVDVEVTTPVDWTPLSGVVTDESSTDPVEGATVIVTDTTTGDSSAALTAEDGSYSFVGISPGDHAVTATADGQASESAELNLSGGEGAQSLDLVLLAVGSVSGRVVDPDGAAVANADISVLTDGGERSSTTAADGTFDVDDVPPGDVTVVVTATGWAGRELIVPVVADQDTDTGDVEVVDGGTISGTVVDAADQPVVGATVGADTEASPTATTGADGSYTIDDVAPGVVEVVAEADGFVDASTTVDVTVDASTTVDLTLAADRRVDVTVVADPGASPVADATVRMTATDAAGVEMAGGVTDASGEVTISGLEPGPYAVSVEGRTVPVDLTSSNAQVTVTIPEPHTITGRVVDASATPLVDIVVEVRSDGAESDLLGEVVTAADGRFTVEAAGGQPVVLLVADPLAGLRRTAVAAAVGGTSTDVGDLAPVATTLTVEMPWLVGDDEALLVLSPAGSETEDALGTWAINTTAPPVTEAEFAGVPDGDYHLTYSDDVTTFRTEISASGDSTETLTMPDLGLLSGIAVDDLGAPLADAVVTAWSATGLELQVSSSESGAWNLGRVPIGEWTVVVTHPDLGVLSIESVTVTAISGLLGFVGLERGPIVTIAPERRVPTASSDLLPDDRGCTSDPDERLSAIGRITSEVVSGAWDGKSSSAYYRVAGQPGFLGSATATEPHGWFRLPDLPDGNYEVVVKADGHRPSASMSFTIPQTVTGNGFRCGASLGNIERGELITDDPEPPPSLPSPAAAKAFLDSLFNEAVLPGREEMQGILDFEPPEKDDGSGGGDCPPPPPGGDAAFLIVYGVTRLIAAWRGGHALEAAGGGRARWP